MGQKSSKSRTSQTQTDEAPVEESFPNILYILESKKNTDMVLRCGSKSYDVHSKILAAHSDIFKAKFDSISGNKTLHINDMSPDVLSHMLHFLYSGQLESITLPLTMKLYEAAKTYEIQPLERKCLELLKAGIREDNVCDILNYSDSKKYGEVKDVAIGYLLTRKKFLLTETWRMFTENKKHLANDIVTAMARLG